MIKLEADELTFSFPEISEQIAGLLKQHIQQLLPTLQLPSDRSELVHALTEQVNSGRRFTIRQNNTLLLRAAESFTVADVEKAFRERVSEVVDLSDSLASVTIAFQRTLRIPDDGKTYPLPASLGCFPLRSVDDFAATAPQSWLNRGGVAMPMHQSEALWINFFSGYPFAVKVAAGKINAVSGEPWTPHLQQEPQNYVVLPEQPWLDGFSVGTGVIRQFVAMPLGAGYSVEEQLTGQAENGGMQLQAYPMRAEIYFYEEIVPKLPTCLKELLPILFAEHLFERRIERLRQLEGFLQESAMGLSAGGKMQQEIYRDPHLFSVWDQSRSRRCFVHLCNSLVWRQITETNPPHPPLTAKEYKQAGIPWFDYYRDDLKPLQGSEQLAGVKSVAALGKEKNSQPLPDNLSFTPELIVQYGNTRRPEEIREFLDQQ